LCCSIRDLTRPGRPEIFRPDPRIVCFNLLSQTERKIQLHPAYIGVIDNDLFAKLTLALGAFALEQVAPTSLRTNDLARGGDFEPFCHGPLGFATCDCFWHGGWKISEWAAVGNNKKVN
jgi:hypothetical protein